MSNSRRIYLSITSLLILCLAIAAPITMAQVSPSTPAPPTVSTEGFPYYAKVTASKLSVRSGAGTNYYRVGQMLKFGEVIKVHKLVSNNQGNWLAITPPEGQYLLISEKFVENKGNGTGTVMGNRINVRAPSPAGPDKSWKILTQVSTGTQVRIIGQKEDWLHIAPIEGAYFYIAAQYVQRATQEDIKQSHFKEAQRPPVRETRRSEGNPQQDGHGNNIVRATHTEGGTLTTPTTQPSETTTEVNPEPKPNEALIAAEEQFAAASQKQVSQQPVAKLIKLYETIAEQDLMDSEKQLVKMRLEILHTRAKLQNKLTQLRITESELEDAQKEKEERERRQEALSRKQFIAVGILKTSAVYDGTRLPLRLRLVDQTTQLTVAYVALPENFKYTDKLNQLVGLTGETKYDDSVKLKVIHVEEIIKLGATE